MPYCSGCHKDGENNYCSICGKSFVIKRIALQSVLQEVFHTFTHFDKGFLYTFKSLILQPGIMQKNFIEGDRNRHQKPFAMFFLCATIYGVSMYFILPPSHGSDDADLKRDFYRHYFVFLQTFLIPVYVTIYYILFRSMTLNYAEAFVSFLYSLCFLLILLIPINMVNLIPGFRFEHIVEIMVLSIYLIVTNINQFRNRSALGVVIKTIVLLLAVEYISNTVMDLILKSHVIK